MKSMEPMPRNESLKMMAVVSIRRLRQYQPGEIEVTAQVTISFVLGERGTQGSSLLIQDSLLHARVQRFLTLPLGPDPHNQR